MSIYRKRHRAVHPELSLALPPSTMGILHRQGQSLVTTSDVDDSS